MEYTVILDNNIVRVKFYTSKSALAYAGEMLMAGFTVRIETRDFYK